MKIRPSIIWFVVVVAATIVLVLRHYKKQPAETPLPAVAATNVAPSSVATRIEPAGAPVGTNEPVTKKPAISNTPNLTLGSKAEREIGILSTYNDQPIVFYGRIIDQFSNAVTGATVNFGVRIRNGYESTVKYGQILSDANGLFTISGYRGESLGIGVKKPGYVLISVNGGGIYSKLWPEDQRAHPDPNNPTIIKMWKLQGAEPLVSIGKEYKIHYTDAPINFDLLAGKIVATGGDITVRVNRSPGVISGRNELNWSVQIEAVDGGIMDSDGKEEVTFEAPESGYQPSITFMFSTNAPYRWSGGFDRGFFLKSRNGQVYSKLGFGFTINRNPDGFMYITFGGVASTNGSRDWEATAPQ
jgi:hypothetical protein